MNKPVAIVELGGEVTWLTDVLSYKAKLYTQDQLEEARKLGMQQERALWNLSESTQEIMNTHPAELTDEEILNEWILISYNPKTYVWADDTDDDLVLQFAKAILRKAQAK